jgi:pimeloyl-ACP methyl ester carboxylesterase
MPQIHANGIDFHVQIADPPSPAGPDIPTVVFVHGLVIDNLSSFYYTLVSTVVGAGARAILYDLRGHGLSGRTASGYSSADAVSDLCALLDALGVAEPVYLVGNSYGGMIAARMAVTAPERVAGLVIIEAECAGEGAATWVEDITNTLTVGALGLEDDRMQERLIKMGARKAAKLAVSANALLNGTSMIDDLASERPVDETELKAIDCPVLGVFGEQSELVSATEYLRRNIRDCRIEIMPGMAHTILREATGPLRDILTSWLPAGNAAATAE